MSERTTTVVRLTPIGQSALAAIGLRGPLAWKIGRSIFEPMRGSLPEVPDVGRFWFGRAGRNRHDEVVLVAKRGDPFEVELHCHGGEAIVRYLIDLTLEAGARESSATTAPLEEALANAPTVRTAAILLDQVEGGAVAVEERMREVAALIEASDRERARVHLVELSRFEDVGRHLTTPWQVVLAGAPNVGKSSLCNAIAGYQRSIVSTIPGTTRDVVRSSVAIDGWPVELLDVAGIRETTDSIERAGVELAERRLAEADLCLWVLDATTEPVYPPKAFECRLVVNKIDLEPLWDAAGIDALPVSAETREGLDDLCEAISSSLVPHPPEPGDSIPCVGEQLEKMATLRQALGM